MTSIQELATQLATTETNITALVGQLLEIDTETYWDEATETLTSEGVEAVTEALEAGDETVYVVTEVSGYTETTDEPLITTHRVTRSELADLLQSTDRATDLIRTGRLGQHDEWLITTSELAEVRATADAARTAKTARDEAIRDALAAGHSQRAVAEAAGLTQPAIGKIAHR